MLWVAAVAVAILLGASIVRGAPWLPTRKSDIERALDMLDLQPGDTVIDLGSGSGTVLVMAARRGCYAIGYEINPLLCLYTRLRSWSQRDKVRVCWADYWSVPLPPTDGVFVFLIGHFMEKLDRKLDRELTRPTKVASYTFPIPGREPLAKQHGVYLYQYKGRQQSIN